MIMKIDDKTGLVLEGGGMRGVFTCGVLDYMMDKKVWFPYGVGVRGEKRCVSKFGRSENI